MFVYNIFYILQTFVFRIFDVRVPNRLVSSQTIKIALINYPPILYYIVLFSLQEGYYEGCGVRLFAISHIGGRVLRILSVANSRPFGGLGISASGPSPASHFLILFSSQFLLSHHPQVRVHRLSSHSIYYKQTSE